MHVFGDKVHAAKREQRRLDAALDAARWLDKIRSEHGEEINSLCDRTVFFPEKEQYDEPKERKFSETEIEVRQCSTVDAIFEENGKGTIPCALNFASYRHPGGGFLNGSMAQEESLCHASLLFPVLHSPRIRHAFYDTHEKKLNHALYASDLLYTPGISFWQNSERAVASVITCAASNKRAAMSDWAVKEEACRKAMENRIDAVLHAAYEKGDEVLILGAFGCGVFGNDATEVAEIFREMLSGKYKGAFRKAVFAVLDKETCEKMRKVLK